MKKALFTYKSDVLTLPCEVLAVLGKASKKEIAVLLSLSAEPLARVDLEAAIGEIEKTLSLSRADVEAALAFWRGTGILSSAEEAPNGKNAPEKPKTAPAAAQSESPSPLVVADGGLPLYSATELSEVLERRKNLASLINECQQVYGKVFNTSEVRVIAGLSDYLGFDDESIVLILSHCVRMDKKSMRYVEKTAISLHDEGIADFATLEERLQRIETMATEGGKIRAMFGAASRSLTAKEKKMIESWLCSMQFPMNVIERAWEITVDSIGEARFSYANTILERWYAEGYRTLADVDRAIAEYKRKKKDHKGSFDTDDFFEAALRRTYGDQGGK